MFLCCAASVKFADDHLFEVLLSHVFASRLVTLLLCHLVTGCVASASVRCPGSDASPTKTPRRYAALHGVSLVGLSFGRGSAADRSPPENPVWLSTSYINGEKRCARGKWGG